MNDAKVSSRECFAGLCALYVRGVLRLLYSDWGLVDAGKIRKDGAAFETYDTRHDILGRYL